MQQTQHQVTTLQRQLRITPRIVQRRTFNHADQHRLLIKTQFVHRAAKVVQAGQRETADLVVARLAEIHLVQVELENAIFAVARIHDHRHIGFTRFTPQRAFVGEEQVFHQLLRQGTAALHRFTGGDIGEEGATNRVRADAVMLVEVAVFGGDQRIDQQIREPGARHKQTLLAVWRLQHGDQPRIEAEEAKVASGIEVFNLAQLVVAEGETRVNLALFAVRKIKRTAQQVNGVAFHAELTRTGNARHFAILRAFQQRNHLFLVVSHARFEANHAPVYGRRQLPHFTVNAAADFRIEIDAPGGHHHDKHQEEFNQPA